MRLWSVLLVVVALVLGGSMPPGAYASPTNESRDLSTPERALRHFVDSVRAGDLERASAVLDLSALPEAERLETGARLAQRLMFVLDQTLWLDWETVSDQVSPEDLDAQGRYLVGHVPLGGAELPIRMRAVPAPSGATMWMFGASTVAAIPALHAEHGAGWLEGLPPWFFRVRILEMAAWQWVGLLVGIVLAFLISLLVAWLTRIALARVTSRSKLKWDDRLVEKSYGPLRSLGFLAALAVVVEKLHLSVPARLVVQQMLVVGFVIALTWLAMRGVSVIAWVLERRLVADDDQATGRGARTQVLVLRKVVSIILLIVGGALVLLQFEMLRVVGTSVLASAGIVGLIIGLAAQRTIGNLLAGVQLSITQPIRIDDTVIVEGEWGWIEEITLTYVVVRVWDLRRLIVPVTRFLEQPFQNWTKVSPELMGTVFIHADYEVPVEKVRAEVRRLCEDHPKWDGKVAGLVVTDATERTVQLRALVSAADAGSAWDLRCAVREGLVHFLQSLDKGRYLPRMRLAPSEAAAMPEAKQARLG